jgi:hypothetical protein
MRSTLIATSILGLGLAPAATRADDTEAEAPTKTKTIGIDGGIALPTGDMSDAVGFGIGALGRFEMPLSGKLQLTARAGFIYHTSKDAPAGPGGGGSSASSSVFEIPVIGGLRYAFSQQPTSAIYGAAELGFVNYRVSTEFGGMSMSGSDTNLGMTLGAGYRTGKLDLRGGLYFPDAGELTDAMMVMATVGYDVTAF